MNQFSLQFPSSNANNLKPYSFEFWSAMRPLQIWLKGIALQLNPMEIDIEMDEYDACEELPSDPSVLPNLRQFFLSTPEELPSLLALVHSHLDNFKSLISALNEEAKKEFTRVFHLKVAELLHIWSTHEHSFSKEQNKLALQAVVSIYLVKNYLLADCIAKTLEKFLSTTTCPSDLTFTLQCLQHVNNWELRDLYRQVYNLGFGESNYQIVKVLATLPEEERLCIELLIKQFSINFGPPNMFEADSNFSNDIADLLKHKPYHKLFKTFCTRPALQFTTKLMDLLASNKLEDCGLLHKDLLAPESIRELILHNSPEKNLQILTEECVTIKSDAIHVYHSLDILTHIIKCLQTQDIKSLLSFDIGNSVNRILKLFKRLLDHKHLPVLIKGSKECQTSSYVAAMFRVALGSHMSISQQTYPIQILLNEKQLLEWFKLAVKWVEAKEAPANLLGSLIAFFQQLLFVDSYQQSASNPESEISKTILDVMNLIDEPSFHVYSILSNWSPMIKKESEEIRKVLHRFYRWYFASQEDYFGIINRSSNRLNKFSEMVVQELTGYFEQTTAFRKLKLVSSPTHRLAWECNSIFRKLFEFLPMNGSPQHAKLAQILAELYIEHAHLLPALNSQRVYITTSLPTLPPQLLEDLLKEIEQVKASYEQIKPEIDANIQRYASLSLKKLKEEEAASMSAYLRHANRLINRLQLKKATTEYPPEFYEKYIGLVRYLSTARPPSSIESQFTDKQTQFLSQMCKRDTVLTQIQETHSEILMIIRYYVCGSLKILTFQEETSLAKELSKVLIELTHKPDPTLLASLKVLLGCQTLEGKKSRLEQKQTINLANGEADQTFRLDTPYTLNFASTFYSGIRQDYPAVVGYALAQNREEEVAPGSKETGAQRSLLNLVIFPSVNIAGRGASSNQAEQKGNQQVTYGMYHQQFETLNKVFIPNGELDLNRLLELYSLENIISHLLEVNSDPTKKILSVKIKDRPLNRMVREIGVSLHQMGYPEDLISAALEQRYFREPDEAVEWIQANKDKLQNRIFSRGLQRSNQSEKDMMSRDEFVKKMSGSMKMWIKALLKHLLNIADFKVAQKMKDLLLTFVFHLRKDDKREADYINFAEKMFTELRSCKQKGKLQIILSVLKSTISKAPKIILEFYRKDIHMLLLDSIDNNNAPQIIQILNMTLPISQGNMTAEMDEYVSFLLDALLACNVSTNDTYEILCKVARGATLHSRLLTKVVSVFAKTLPEGANQDLNLLHVLLRNDDNFLRANIELDLKGLVFSQISKLRNNAIIVDAESLSPALGKYGKTEMVTEVCRKHFLKKNSRQLAYDVTMPGNALDEFSVLHEKFLFFPLQNDQKSIVDVLITLVMSSTLENEEERMVNLHRILMFYRLLIPYAVRTVNNPQQITLLDWLVTKSKTSTKAKHSFLVFLALHNHLFVLEELKPILNMGQYVSAILTQIYFRQLTRQSRKSTLLSALYLLQIKSYAELSALPQVAEGSSLNDLIASMLSNQLDKVQFKIVSNYVTIVEKKKMFDALKPLYTFPANESSVDRQFLFLDGYFQENETVRQRASPLRPNMHNMHNLHLLSSRIMEQEDDEEEYMFENEADHQFIGSSFLNRRPMMRMPNEQMQPIVTQEHKFFLPVQKKQNDPPKEPRVKKENEMSIDSLLSLFITLWGPIQEPMCIETASSSRPNSKIVLSNVPNVTLPVEKITVNINLTLKKLYIFEKLIIQINNEVSGQVWEKKKAEASIDQTLETMLLERFSSSRGPQNREVIAQLHRLIQGRYREQSRPQPAPILINIPQIMNGLAEYVEVKQTMPVQVEPQGIQLIPQPINQLELDIPVGYLQQIQEVAMQPVEPVAIQPVAIQPVAIQPVAMQPVALETVVIEPVAIQPTGQMPELVQPMELQQMQEQQIEVPMVDGLHAAELLRQIEEIEIIPENFPIEEEVVPSVPMDRQREILTAFGLGQSFLGDMGVDSELFDQLPEDLQVEQITSLMNQQRLPRQGDGNSNGGDLQNDNLAFLASLDPQTRMQILSDSTPEFLMTLPPQVRAEAENYRSQQLRRIIQEDQQPDDRNHSRERPKATLNYPEVTLDIFPPISKTIIHNLLRGCLIRGESNGLKLLLENKRTQLNTLAFFLLILRTKDENIERIFHLEKDAKFFKVEGSDIKKHVLLLLTNHSKSCPYKDSLFLKEPFALANPLEGEIQEGTSEMQEHPWLSFLDECLAQPSVPFLSVEIMKIKPEEAPVPEKTLRAIVRCIKENRLPLQFYEEMGNIAKSESLKQIFSQEFPESNPPKITLLSKMLKYPFSRLSYLSKLHLQILAKSNSQHYPFLNNIFCIYNEESLRELEPALLKYKHVHTEIIKSLCAAHRAIHVEPIALILKCPKLLDFETKKLIFKSHPKLRKANRHRLHIEIKRENIFQQSYNQLMNRTLKELDGRMHVTFVDEPASDAGGVSRQWFLCLSKEIFNPNYALFEKSSSGVTYQPNPKSYINPDHLNYFKFIGRIVGKALTENELIDAYFTRAFYKLILGQKLQFTDLEQQDLQFYNSMEWLKKNPIDEDIFTFSYLYDNFGHTVVKELIPGGKDIVVNEANKLEYIEKYCLSKMRDAFAQQVEKFLEGLHELVPAECISFFEAKQLELLISGLPFIDFEDLKRNTDLSGYKPDDNVIKWFWEIVKEYSQEELAKLVQFITGTSRVPPEGFSNLVGMNGLQRISLHKDHNSHQLPKSHTCFYQMDLPNYSTKEILQQKLRICIEWGSQGFGFM